MKTTGDFRECTCWGKLMVLLVQNLLSLVIAAVGMAILIRTSAVLVPSLDCVAHK
ncbi:hypothetical protein DPMN_089296 [Dreissena polymorpha]|uniref:Uncharacterized protein n=1 Tax=Dreissena polymorpha TaxID=45954 RepID=A0A9D4KXZ4_DREPO|nr:hypothetical protein DPMN_089296 [Dreissena polymorpha]